MMRGIVFVIIYLASLVAILFVSAGRVDWPMGWASLGIYILISIINFMLADPTLVTERAQMRTDVNIRDMILASLSFLFFFPLTLLVAGLDIGRYAWSPPIPLAVQLIALFAFALGNAIGSWAMVRNKFFSTFLRIQKDRDNHQWSIPMGTAPRLRRCDHGIDRPPDLAELPLGARPCVRGGMWFRDSHLLRG